MSTRTTAVSPAPAPTAAPRFASFHTLLMRVDDRADLPRGVVWVRDKNGVLQELAVDAITPERQPAFDAALAAGRVYALWGHRFVEFDELGPEWHLATRRAGQASPPEEASPAPVRLEEVPVPPARADGVEQPEGHSPTAQDVKVEVNHKGQLVRARARSWVALHAYLQLRAAQAESTPRREAYAAAAAGVERKHLAVVVQKPVEPVPQQGNLL